jgi:two-component system CheB/CheR fusion protein
MNPALDRIPCGFLAFADDGRIVAVNDTLCTLLGYERDELLREPHVQILFSPGGRVFYQTHLFPLLKLQQEIEEIYISLRTKSGEEVPFLINGRREETKDGFQSHCILMRVRQRNHFESELLNAKKAAQQASKAKDDFLAALSHELRNPLTPVLMLSTAMELHSEFPDDVREQAGIIRRNAELEVRLIDDLLDHTRIRHGKLSLVLVPLDVHALLGDTQEIVKSEGSGKRVTVKFEKNATAHYVNGDGARLQQVFWNVIKNAVKFTPPDGAVHVVTSNDAEGNIIVRVTDSGIGIPSEVLPRIFNAFEQGSVSTRKFGGLGLGLAISQGIVSMHGGSIWAESEGTGHGATFSVALKTTPAPATAALASAPVSASKVRRLRLLLVEDHQSTRDVLAAILRRKGYEVHAAATGAAALELTQSAGPLDVLISDLGLPDLTGLELVKQIQQLQPHMTAIALSGYGMEEDVQHAIAAGFIAHLVKPVSVEQLCGLLDQVEANTSKGH